MPNLSIKDVPESVAAAIRQRAARNHRSLQGELMALVTQAAAEEAQAAPALGWGAAAGAVPAPDPSKTLEQIARERRRRQPKPVPGARGAERVRADRDAR